MYKCDGMQTVIILFLGGKSKRVFPKEVAFLLLSESYVV